ncbi:MAG: hypothetical protein U5K56_09645 [Halioglobus sp.]|nr:hypothetical protein [Halioglobus sp.]
MRLGDGRGAVRQCPQQPLRTALAAVIVVVLPGLLRQRQQLPVDPLQGAGHGAAGGAFCLQHLRF